MKFIKWKNLIITNIVCLSAILPGVVLWEKLPEQMAIHFDLNNNPDGFASKGFVVFGMPLLMVLLQTICCIINDTKAKKHGDRVKLERVVKWIIPIMTIILQAITLGYGLGFEADIRRIVALIVGVVFIVTGNYLPKLDYIKNYDIDTEKARKINRFIGFESVIMGLLFIVSIFLPTVFTIVCLFLMIPYAVIGILYGIITARK